MNCAVRVSGHADGVGNLAALGFVRPASGSMNSVMIFSGVAWATSSMSMPPSLEAMKATFCVARSVTTDT
jgi:hypothetical protein